MPLTLNKSLLGIVEDYRATNGVTEHTTEDVAAWAIREDLWSPDPSKILKLAAAEFRAAMKSEVEVDPQGRQIRSNLTAKFKQQNLWGNIHEVGYEFAQVAFTQDQKRCAEYYAAHKQQKESYNENDLPEGYPPITTPNLFDMR